jgi:hypothetical protein
LPDRDFDVTEVAVPWRILRDSGHQVLFATSITVQPTQLLPPGTPHYEITAAAIAEAMPVFVDLVRNTQ